MNMPVLTPFEAPLATPPPELQLEAEQARIADVANFIGTSLGHARVALTVNRTERQIKKAEASHTNHARQAKIVEQLGDKAGAEPIETLSIDTIDELLSSKIKDVGRKKRPTNPDILEADGSTTEIVTRKDIKTRKEVERLAAARDAAAVDRVKSLRTGGTKNRGEIDKSKLKEQIKEVERDDTLNDAERRAAILRLKADAERKPTKRQASDRSAILKAERNLSNHVTETAAYNRSKASEAQEKIESRTAERQTATEKRDLLRISRVMSREDRDVNRNTRSYNRWATSANNKRAKLVARQDELQTINERLSNIDATDLSDENKALAASLEAEKNKILKRHARLERKVATRHSAAVQKNANIISARNKASETRQYFEDLKRNNVIPFDNAVETLSYSDVAMSPDEKAAMEAHTRNSPNGLKYVSALTELVSEHGIPKLTQLTHDSMLETYRRLSTHGIDLSRYGRSVSWFLWDLAKQSYYSKNPDSADPLYIAADPMENPEKINEIINRHIGWELYGAYANTPDADKAAFIASHNIPPVVVSILDSPPKANGTLSSSKLAELGSVIF